MSEYIHRRRDQGRARQATALATADHKYDRWSAEEDAIISSRVSIPTMCEMTGRTYWAVAARRKQLGVQGTRVADTEDTTNLLCACASLDGEHEDWCPQA